MPRQCRVLHHSTSGSIDKLIESVLTPVSLRQPAFDEKLKFLGAARGIYSGATFEPGLDDAAVARLTANTPNRGLETHLRASHRRSSIIYVEELLAQKRDDTVALSENTLSVLETQRIEGLRLVGRNIERPRELLVGFGDALFRGDPHMPSNVILVGAPGVGKTDLAVETARAARASAYQYHSPKDGIVGGTEHKARVQARALREWTPNVALIDEITEALPMERSEFDGDSGASRAVQAALLTELSDESRRGQALIIGTTNRAWAMSAAMRSRFTWIPVLSPLREDYPAIIIAIAARVAPDQPLTEEEVRQSADLFYDKGASAREIRAEIEMAMLDMGKLSEVALLKSARDICPDADRGSTEYADLWAIKACRSRRYFPWYGDGRAYPFPPHLAGIIDPRTEDIDYALLEERIGQLKPRVNV